MLDVGLSIALFTLGSVLCLHGALRPVPHTRSRWLPGYLAVALLIPFAIAAWPPLVTTWAASGPLRGIVGCFAFGASLSVPLFLALWYLDRDDPLVRVPMLQAAACGLAANATLALHCTSADASHRVLGHAPIGLAWLLALFVLRGMKG